MSTTLAQKLKVSYAEVITRKTVKNTTSAENMARANKAKPTKAKKVKDGADKKAAPLQAEADKFVTLGAEYAKKE